MRSFLLLLICILGLTKLLAIHPSSVAVFSSGGVSRNENIRLLAAAKVPVAQQPQKVQSKCNTFKATVKKIGPTLAAAFCAAAIMYPFDLVRALQMANANSGTKLSTVTLLNNFRKVHGISGFFTQGLAPELARSTWMRFLKFSIFPMVHKALHGISEVAGSPASKATAALLAAVPEALSIMPLELAKVMLQLDTTNKFKNNMFSAMKEVYTTRGPSAFLIGYVGVQYRQAMWSAAYFSSLSEFEKAVNKVIAAVAPSLVGLPGTATFCQLTSGFLAGVFGAMLNTPGDTIRTNIQKAVLGGSATSMPTFLGVGRDIVSKRGVGALYAGFSMKAIHLGGGGALMAFLIPFFKGVFEKL